VYIQDTDYNSLPEYVSQLHLAQKIDKLSNADNKQENWIELHKNSQIIYRTLVELKDKFEEYKQAKENYESNLQAIVSLNVRLVDLASDA
jgi:tetratricopeptide (TPR) repeat protein